MSKIAVPKIIELISQKIENHQNKIDDFFAQKFNNKCLNFYNSVDLRHCGYKIAVVDTNCFPAGFNNLIDSDIEIAKTEVKKFFESNFSKKISKIILLPENHTRNQKYFENLAVIQKILNSYADTKIGTLIPEIQENKDFILENNEIITLHPLKILNDKITTFDGFSADVIILNNDLTDEIPKILQNTDTSIIPSVKLGWYQRSKSKHFDLYNQVVEEFCKLIDLDPWLISTYHQYCDNVDFKQQINLQNVANHVDDIIKKTQEKYHQYGINDQPYAFVKADNGTYGMAVWSVSSGDEVLEINKKERNKMSAIKGSIENHKVMIQEGIKTIDKINSYPCEPMIYLINSQVVANLFRANSTRSESSSLNALGASFYNFNQLNFDHNFNYSQKKLLAVYKILAKLASYITFLETSIYK
jgi:glutamate--cysteine ligase